MTLPAPSPTTTALVTGASSGIGTELARELARRGHSVTLVARREDRLKQLADELGRAHSVRTEILAADLSDAGARAQIPGALRDRGLVVDILVNNAGLSTTGPVYKSVREREMAMIRTDVEAVADMCCLFLPTMVERGRGAVLNVASTAAFQPLPGQAGYGGCKAFVLSYTYAIRAELLGKGVRATALCPGPVKTEFAQAAGFTKEDAEGSLPKMMWLTAAQVARAAVDGMDAGRAVVIPGVANRIGARIAHNSPRKMITTILARQHPALREV